VRPASRGCPTRFIFERLTIPFPLRSPGPNAKRILRRCLPAVLSDETVVVRVHNVTDQLVVGEIHGRNGELIRDWDGNKPHPQPRGFYSYDRGKS
jgi:hypothetical protein